jgi:TonB family protein
MVIPEKPGPDEKSCARAQFKIGTSTVNNNAFAVICFNQDGTLFNVVKPGYEMEFHDAQTFGKKKIAHTFMDDPEPGTKLVGKVEILEPLQPGTSFPTIPDLPNQSTDPVESAKITQDGFESLANHPILTWPPVHSGSTTGKLSMYVSVDTQGHVREAYPLNSDNAGLQPAARDQLLKWQLKPAVNHGNPVQLEAALTFEFSTTTDGTPSPDAPKDAITPATSSPSKPIVVSPKIAYSLQTRSFAPVYPQNLKMNHMSGKVELDTIIGKDGQIVSLTPKYSTDPAFTQAAVAAVQHWAYKPYLLNGSPVEIETTITVNFNAQ